jgi:hypothetical protein
VRGTTRVVLLSLLAATALSAVLGSTASADVRWLCRPALASDPCRGDQTTTFVKPDGASHVGQPKFAKQKAIDCFYVYPTTSNQPTSNATKSPDPEIKSIVQYQAQRFSNWCRVFVPLYRQVTAAGVVMASQTHDTAPYDTAFADVREAWKAYLKSYNRGRGVILVGHSQGSRMLRALIRKEIDPKPAARRRIVSAIIPGANANVADFKHVPPCASRSQTGCVISYSTFNETPPDNSRFGRTDTDPVGGALGLPHGPGIKVLCTDPAKLAGTADLKSLLPTEPFAPGIVAALILRLYGGPPPSADTPWLQPQDHYTGRCVTSNHARVLMIAPIADARRLNPSPDATWGVHLVDVNIALGDLMRIVRAQATSWVQRQSGG